MCAKFRAIIFCLLFIQNIYGQNINWESFLSRNDMTFDTLTTKWQEGVFTGNGLIGSMIFMENKNALRIELGRTDVTDHRISGNPSALYAKARLPIGYFSLNPVGKIIKILQGCIYGMRKPPVL